MARGEIKALVFAEGVEVEAPEAAPSTRFRQSMAWNGTDYTKTVDVSAFTDSAKTCIWMMQDIDANSSAQLTGYVVDFPSADEVRITFGSDFPPASGTYYLVGV